MNLECIIYEKHQGIATIKLNRPKVLNAMNKQLWLDIQGALDVDLALQQVGENFVVTIGFPIPDARGTLDAIGAGKHIAGKTLFPLGIGPYAIRRIDFFQHRLELWTLQVEGRRNGPDRGLHLRGIQDHGLRLGPHQP